MKVKDLFEKQNIIEGNVALPRHTTELGYHGAIVTGDLICFGTKILSLEGSPEEVGGNFDCSHTRILYLYGAPRLVTGNFRCSGTKISSLDNAPKYIGGLLDCYGTEITSLHNIHKTIKHIGGELHLNSKIQTNVLGVMMIEGLKRIIFHAHSQDQSKAIAIINKYLQYQPNPRKRDIHRCQIDLIEAGLEAYAQL